MSGVKGMGSRAPKRNAMLIAEARTKIQTTQIVNRLQGHIHGKWEMSATQIQAAGILLKKALPDLAAVTHSGDADNPIVIQSPAEKRERALAHLSEVFGQPPALDKTAGKLH